MADSKRKVTIYRWKSTCTRGNTDSESCNTPTKTTQSATSTGCTYGNSIPPEEPSVKTGKSPEAEIHNNRVFEIMGEPSSEGAVVVFGRFNPPTTGHEKLLKSANSEAERLGFDLRVYPSRTVDVKESTTALVLRLNICRRCS